MLYSIVAITLAFPIHGKATNMQSPVPNPNGFVPPKVIERLLLIVADHPMSVPTKR